LYFKEHDNTLKQLRFSLTEAVLQVSSAIFTVRHMSMEEFVETQEDIFFIMNNVYNDFLIALRKSSGYYYEEFKVRTSQRNMVILILFLASIFTLLLTIVILFPVVSSVNSARVRVLTLFIEIPNFYVIQLALKCERFLNNFHEEQNEDLDSDDEGTAKNEEGEVGANMGSKRSGHKSAKNSAKSN